VPFNAPVDCCASTDDATLKNRNAPSKWDTDFTVRHGLKF